MRTLEQALQDHDIGHLRIVAELWGLELPAGGPRQAAAWLAVAMADQGALAEILEALPPSGLAALGRLLEEGGRLPWADFTRQHGPVREMGPGRRDREKPWRAPVSDSERLLYRGLIGRAFADTQLGPKEFAFIPNDLIPHIPRKAVPLGDLLGNPTGDPPHAQETNTGLVDDAVTLLADLRRAPAAETGLGADRKARLQPFFVHPQSLPLLAHLLHEMALVADGTLRPNPERVGPFLEARRAEALARLTVVWKATEAWNDFDLLNHLEPGPGGWPNKPAATRRAALDLITRIPVGQWWDLDSFLQGVKDHYPSFCRPGGEFDSWYLRDRRTGAFLRGYESWEAVDGALLRALMLGPLHWLGALDLGAPEAGEHCDRIRLTPWSEVLSDDGKRPALEEPETPGRVLPDGRLELPRSIRRPLRYQIARLSSWLSFDRNVYHYRLRPSRVQAAAQQGLKPHHLHKLLGEISPSPLPPGLKRALDRLAADGIEARLRAATIIQVEDEAMLDQIFDGKKTGPLLGERLGPRAAIIDREKVSRLVELAAEAGLLIEPFKVVDEQGSRRVEDPTSPRGDDGQ